MNTVLTPDVAFAAPQPQLSHSHHGSLISPIESAERDLRPLVPVVLVAGTTTWALVPPASAHMPVLQLDRQKHPRSFSNSSLSLCPSPVSCTAIALTKHSLKRMNIIPSLFFRTVLNSLMVAKVMEIWGVWRRRGM